MSLVSTDNMSVGPRVGPKVFADVPTQAEVQQARRGAGVMMLVSVFLAGLLLASVIGFWLYLTLIKNPEIDQLKKDNDQLAADYSALQTQHAPVAEFSTIGERQAEALQLRGEVEGKLRQDGWGDVRARLLRGNNSGNRVLLAQYDLNPRAWRDLAQQQVDTQVNSLQALSAAIDKLGPLPRQVPVPPPVAPALAPP